MKTENSTGQSPDSIARWLALLLVVTGMIALSAASCKSPSRMTTTSSLLNDSLQSKKGFALIQQPVPPSVAQTTFPTNLLATIPVGTGFSTCSGQATVDVKRLPGDSIQVTATCDSLARQIIILTEELTRIRNETGQTVEEPPPKVVHEPTGWQWFQIWIGRIALLTISLTIVYRLFKQRLKKL